MKKELVKRCLLGMLIACFLNGLIPILISVSQGGDIYYPCVPEFAAQMPNELIAVIVQGILSAVMGAILGAASLIWEIDRWSILKQTIAYFLILSPTVLGVAYFLYWMEHDLYGILRYLLIFTGIGVSVWIAQYLFWKNRISAWNAALPR